MRKMNKFMCFLTGGHKYSDANMKTETSPDDNNIVVLTNPMVGAAGISAFPMSARVIQKMGQEEDPQNYLLMHAVGANVAGQIASVLAGGMILYIIPQMIR